jgi:hypothetical protein
MKSLNSTFNSHLNQSSTQEGGKAPHNLILSRNTHFPTTNKGTSVDQQASQRTLGSLRNHLEFSKPTIFDQMLTDQ